MSYVSHAPGQSRVFDPVYDPLFIVSGPKDAWRANTYALSKSAPIHVFTKYDVMFSDLPKESRSIYWKQQSLLPHFRITGGEDATDDGNTEGKIKSRAKLDVTGKYRGCFFRHIPDAGTVSAPIVNLQLNLLDEQEGKGAPEPEEDFKSAACQTIYRESSAQTHPYQPDAVIGSGETNEPEVLRISKLISGYDQPGEFEAKIIERVRRRRKWEKELPTLPTADDFKKRAVVLEAFEWEEWMSREDEIEAVQKMRLDLVYRLLQKRNRCFEYKSATKLENSTKRIEDKRKKQLDKVKKDHERELRKLEAKHQNISRKYKKGNIIDDHTDPSSELYGPQIRFGVNPNRRHYIGFRKKFYARLDDLDKKIKETPSLICPMAKWTELAKPKEVQKEITQGFRNDANLGKLYEALKSLRVQSTLNTTPKCLLKKENDLGETIGTPVGNDCGKDQLGENEDQALIYLQKIIKGRAVQAMLYRGKQKHLDLMKEMCSTNVLSETLFPAKSKEMQKKRTFVINTKKRLQQIFKSEHKVKEVLNESEAKIVSGLFDFLEKELKRLSDQRKMHAIYMLAEKERKKREAFEAGKRQRENQRREEHAEIYSNLTKASQDTVTLYLENVLMEEATFKAERDAREKIQTMAKHIDREASQTGKDHKQETADKILSSEEEDYIATLVNDFVFPEVQKQLARNRMELRRRKYMQAAHNELYQNVENTFRIPPDEGPEIADNVLTDLIIKTIDSEAALSDLMPAENVAHHEAMSTIKKIIKRILPSEPEGQGSAEEIVRASVSELTKDEVVATKIAETPVYLENIVDKVTSELWKAAYDDVKPDKEVPVVPRLSYKNLSDFHFFNDSSNETIPSQSSERIEGRTPDFYETILSNLKIDPLELKQDKPS